MTNPQQVVSGAGPLPSLAELKALGIQNRPHPPELPRCRMFLSGVSKVGKSNFLAGVPNSLILDIRGGSHSLLGQRAHVLPIKDYAHLKVAVETLITLKKSGRSPYSVVSIDVGNEWQSMVSQNLAKEFNVKYFSDIGQSGWERLRDETTSVLTRLHEAGYGWIVTAHLVSKLINEQTVYQPAIRGSLLEFLYNDPEIIAVLTKTTREVLRTTREKKAVLGTEMEVETPLLGPDGRQLVDRTVQFCLDARSTNDAKCGGSRVPIDETIVYGAWTPAAPIYGYDLLKQRYDVARTMITS